MARGGRTSRLRGATRRRHLPSLWIPQTKQQSCQTLMMLEITKPYDVSMPFFPAARSRGEPPGAAIRQNGLDVSQTGVGCMTVLGVSPFLFSPFHNIFQRTGDGSTQVYQPAHAQSFRAKGPTYLRCPPTSEFAPRARPINPSARDIVPFRARTKYIYG
jgi:hypothetical protein